MRTGRRDNETVRARDWESGELCERETAGILSLFSQSLCPLVSPSLCPAVSSSRRLIVSLSICLVLLLNACSEIKSPKTEPFISQNTPPLKQEFRWSNGKLPKSFDPARVSAAPETDVIRAIYDGLTEIDSKTLEPNPAIATKWVASQDYKTWTFYLRKDARWTNGEIITAQNFIESWKRLTLLGDKVPQRSLLKNIVGMDSQDVMPVFAEEPSEETEKEDGTKVLNQQLKFEKNAGTANQFSNEPNQNLPTKSESKPKGKSKFGIEALDDFTLKITLVHPDRKFSALVAHPIFRPIYGDGKEFEKDGLNPEIVTSGAFRVNSIAKDSIVLERSANYWEKNKVKLEKVKFVSTETAEQALTAYRAGQVDVVTNANFAPLALKLLKTYDDLHESKHSALSYYEFNLGKKPFDDARVREALAIAIERERLTEDEMDGSTEPALNFQPFSGENQLKQDLEKAKKLLNEAGFPNGQNFPPIKLLITRNDLQKRIANTVKKMWKKTLNVETEIVIKERADFENASQNGEFDIVRRGIVMPTNDETTNMLAMFEKRQTITEPKPEEKSPNPEPTENQILNEKIAESPLDLSEFEENAATNNENTTQIVITNPEDLILTENEALEKLPAIPLYFPMSYSLVKPYVQGFEMNALDAPSLKNVEIDSNWQAENKK